MKALLQDAMPASLPPSVTPSVKDSDGSKANIAAIGLTVAGASLLTNEYLPSSGDGSDKPVKRSKGQCSVLCILWLVIGGLSEVMTSYNSVGRALA